MFMTHLIYKNIVDYMLANLGGTFKNGYHWVELIRQRDNDRNQTFPGYYTEGQTEPRPLLNDHQTNYFYLRRIGEISSEDGPLYSSCGSDLIDTHPMRAVFHIRKGRDHKGEGWVRDLKFFLSQWAYTPPANSGINRAVLSITSADPDKYNVLDNETTGATWNPLDEDTIVSIDFDLVITHSPGSCLSNPTICQTTGDIAQVDPCPTVAVTDTDDTVTNVPAGGVFTCTKQQVDPANAVIWANFTNTAEVDGYGLRDGVRVYSSHCLQKNTGVGGSPDAGASSSVSVTAINTTLSIDGFEAMLIGLKPGPPAVAVPSTDIIEHAFYIQSASNGKIDIRELASNKTGGVFPLSNVRLNYDVDTELEVKFNAGKIQYLLNGILQYTSATTYPISQEFHAYAVISQGGGAFLSTEWTL